MSEPAAVLAQGPQDLAGSFVEAEREGLKFFEYLLEARSGVATGDRISGCDEPRPDLVDFQQLLDRDLVLLVLVV